MAELGIELISEMCKECPRLELETQILMGNKSHRCKNLQLCREVLGFWKEKNRIHTLQEIYEKERGENT